MRGLTALWLSYVGLPLALGGLVWSTPAPPSPPQRKVDFAREILQSLPVYDITIEEVDIDEIIRDIFAGKREASALIHTP